MSIHLHLIDDDLIHDDADTFEPPALSVQPLQQEELLVCSLCLRVLRAGQWVEARDVIRELRSYELPTLPGFLDAECEDCRDAIDARRGEARQAVAS
jgi:hypothetical protein